MKLKGVHRLFVYSITSAQFVASLAIPDKPEIWSTFTHILVGVLGLEGGNFMANAGTVTK